VKYRGRRPRGVGGYGDSRAVYLSRGCGGEAVKVSQGLPGTFGSFLRLVRDEVSNGGVDQVDGRRAAGGGSKRRGMTRGEKSVRGRG